MKIYHYTSNNSGGSWWLTDQNWLDLEKEGWKVLWKRDDPYARPDENGRWLGALATEAEKEFHSKPEAVAEFERITGANVDDEGCPCCGQPHYISEK